MDEFRNYLKRRGKKAHVVEGLVSSVERFDAYLQTQPGKDLHSAKPEDIESYAGWLEETKEGSAGKAVRGIALYYAMTGNDVMRSNANEIREAGIVGSRKGFHLRELRGVDDQYIDRLERAGVSNALQMIEAGKTPAMRLELSRSTGVPVEAILEYVKLSDLSRIGGLKGVRARLYYDSGVDSLDKLAGWDAEGLRIMLENFFARTGFDGIAPLPKEVISTVNRAKTIERFVEYE